MSGLIQGAVLGYLAISLARDFTRFDRWIVRRRKAARDRREARATIDREMRMRAHERHAEAMIIEVVRKVSAGGGA